MAVVRVYVPVGRDELQSLASSSSLAASSDSPLTAYAVTSALRERAPGLDVEDLEFAAFSDAVAAAGARRSSPGHRRVVVAADADPAWVEPAVAGAHGGAGAPSAVSIVTAVPLGRVASFHVDEESAQPGEGAPSAGSDPADAEEEAAGLLWYDVTELDDVCGFLG
ncbi:MAG: hypothetical protein JWP82_1092 [Humibacillus sp.]|nr:hypothetical protein [Humibacillus sp.]